jgi:hypothetical protein
LQPLADHAPGRMLVINGGDQSAVLVTDPSKFHLDQPGAEQIAGHVELMGAEPIARRIARLKGFPYSNVRKATRSYQERP